MHDIMLSSVLIINLNKALTYKNHNNYYLILTCVIAGARCVSSSIPTTTQTSSKLLISLPGSMLSTSLLFPVTPEANHITELGFNFLNKIIVFFVDSQVQKFIFGLFNQCLYLYQNKGPCGARVQNHSTVTCR